MNPEVIMWILGFGAQVEVLAPEKPRNQVAEEVKRVAMIYESDNLKGVRLKAQL